MTPEKIEQERLAFEAWMDELYPTNPQTERVGDEYSRLGTQYKWEGWQARAAQSEWISVEDRLPEKEGYYLTCAIGCAVRICQFDGTYFSYQQYDEEEWEFVEVIWFPDYWLSIPFPPTTNPAA